MATKEIQKHGGALMRPAKGETMNPNGRPRKYISILKEQGYKLSEVNDCIQTLMSMTEEELRKVNGDKHATILETTIAAAMIKSKKNGSLYSLETLLTRVYGKPKETIDAAIITDYKITLNLK
jgi:hypothetical protein